MKENEGEERGVLAKCARGKTEEHIGGVGLVF